MILPMALGLALFLMFGPYLFDPYYTSFPVTPLHVVIALFMLVGGVLMVAFGAERVRCEWSAWRRRRTEGREL